MSHLMNSKKYLVLFTIVLTFTLGACASGKKGTTEEGMNGTDNGVMTEEQMQDEVRKGFNPPVPGTLNDIYFEFDQSDITDEARAILQANADWILANPGSKIQIEGHCDERGTEEYNLALGERRANSVKNYLASLGVTEDRLYTISYGEELPADPGHDEAAWSKNRRAHFLVTN